MREIIASALRSNGGVRVAQWTLTHWAHMGYEICSSRDNSFSQVYANETSALDAFYAIAGVE